MTTTTQRVPVETGLELQRLSRVAGALFLVLLFLGPFSIMYVPGQLVVSDDAAATVANVAESEGLLRLAVLSDVVIFVTEIAMAVVLYRLFRSAGFVLSMIAMTSRLAQAIVMAVNVVLYLGVLALVTGEDYSVGLTSSDRDGVTLLLFVLHEYGVYAGQVFFGLSLVFLGLLVRRSGMVPRVLGALVVVGGVGYLADCLASMVLPAAGGVTSVVVVLTAMVGELPLFLWLLVRGVRPAAPSTTRHGGAA